MAFNRKIGLTALACVFVAIGCAGGGGGHTTELDTLLSDGNTALSSIVADPSRSTSANFGSAASKYQQARALDATNQKAAIGLAISTAGQAIAQLQETLGLSPDVAVNPLVAASQQVTLLPVPRLPQAGSGLDARFTPLTLVLSAAIQKTSAPTPAQVKAALLLCEQRLQSVDAILSDNVVAGADNASFTLQGPRTAKGTLTLGTGELYALRAQDRMVLAALDGALAYELDQGAFDFNANFAQSFPDQVTRGGTVGRSGLLPPGPFLTLKADGAQRLQDFKSKLNEAAADIIAAANILQTRGTLGFVFDLAPPTPTDLQTALAFANSVKAYLDGPRNVHLSGGGSTTLNVSAWTDGTPPKDLKPFIPVAMMGWLNEFGGYTMLPISINDSTFGGLFPAGLPDELLYASPSDTIGLPNSAATIGDVDAFMVAYREAF